MEPPPPPIRQWHSQNECIAINVHGEAGSFLNAEQQVRSNVNSSCLPLDFCRFLEGIESPYSVDEISFNIQKHNSQQPYMYLTWSLVYEIWTGTIIQVIPKVLVLNHQLQPVIY